MKNNTIKINTSEIDNYFKGLAAMQAKAVLSANDNYTIKVKGIKYIINN